MIQKINKDTKVWYDEQGKEIPCEYLSGSLKLKESTAAILVRRAKVLNLSLKKFKKEIADRSLAVHQKAMEDYKAKGDTKGSYTYFNFDRSIKIEVSIAERIDFDDLAIKAAKEKLDLFLNANLDAKTEFLKDMVIDAFSTSRGKIDSKKVISLMRYQTKITDQLFQEAIQILSDGIRRPGSKTYFRIFERIADGSYKLIELNFSAL
jgi:predicted HTH domain antitoxin